MILTPFRLLYRVFKRYREERYAQTAAALSFTTLLGLVPMIAVAVTLISLLPFGNELSNALQKFLLANLLPDKAGVIIARYVGQFAHKGAHLTWLGIGALALTALMQMLTIEHTFNAIWRVKDARPWLRRILIHVLALLFGPLVFGGSLAAFTYIATAALGLVDEPLWMDVLLFRLVPASLVAVFLGLLYWFVPNRNVVRAHAAIGGIVSALAFFGLQRLFSIYIANFTSYSAVYGTFAVVPIFLLWLYVSWMVILVGALLTAEIPRAGR